jgi:hypothetical protein
MTISIKGDEMPYYSNGIPNPSMAESFELLIRLMDDGLNSWAILKANGVRHQTIRNHRRIELKKRMAIADDNCHIQKGVTLKEVIEGLDMYSGMDKNL